MIIGYNDNILSMKMNRKIELATKMFMHEKYFGGENIQIMNYGIGGIISAHTDSRDWKTPNKNPEYLYYAGPRLITFMTYLTGTLFNSQ